MKSSIYLLIATLTLTACGGGQDTDPEATLTRLKKERAALDQQIMKLESQIPDTARKFTSVAVTELQPAKFQSYIEVQSQITGDENINATPQMQGVVRKILVRPGQKVQKGQVLASLDAAAVEQQILAQEAQLTLAKALYEKQQKLWDQNIGTEVQLLQAKANYESMQSQHEASIAQRNMYRIVSPISGTVDLVNLKEGDATMPGSPVGYIRVVNHDKLKAEANLGENYLGKVRSGDPVTLLFPESGDSIQSRISYVSQAVDPVSRGFTVQVTLGGNKSLHPNMSCRMKIYNYTNDTTLVVPISVIQRTAAGDMLYVAENNKAMPVIITTGQTSDGKVEVLSGLKPGDKVITEGHEDLDRGTLIAIQ